jgi:hypothetical protein
MKDFGYAGMQSHSQQICMYQYDCNGMWIREVCLEVAGRTTVQYVNAGTSQLCS